MNDMRAVIVPKSDQINADDLLAGPRTITITSVAIRPGTEQPVSIFFEADGGKPYKPCKSMARVMVHCWGPDANEYVGRSMTLYCDPTVRWGGMEVGGIRISAMTHIKGRLTMALTATKGDKKPFTVQLLAAQPAAIQEAPKADPRVQYLDKLDGQVSEALNHADARERIDMLFGTPSFRKAEDTFTDDLAARLKLIVETAWAQLAERDAAAANEPEVVG